jgi:hypothetical protein
MGQTRLREIGACLLGWPSRPAAHWAVCEPRASGGELGRWVFGPIVQRIIEFFYIFKPFQYLLPQYDSNSNSNFE